MTANTLIPPPRAPRPPALAEILPLLEAIPVAGPPAILLAGPLVLFGLMVAGAFACLCTLLVLLVGAVALAGLLGALLASPYLLIRHVRGHRSRRASSGANVLRSVAIEPRRVVA